MARKLTGMFLGLVVGTSLLVAEEGTKEFFGYPLDRYQAIREKSPFSKETPVEETVAGPLFGQDLVLTGHYQLGDALYAVILNTKSQERFTASSIESRVDRMRVITLMIDLDPAKSIVVVQLGAEQARLKFDIAKKPKEPQKQEVAQMSQPTPVSASDNNSIPKNSDSNPLSRVRGSGTKPRQK